jgi:hypothetical protein
MTEEIKTIPGDCQLGDLVGCRGTGFIGILTTIQTHLSGCDMFAVERIHKVDYTRTTEQKQTDNNRQVIHNFEADRLEDDPLGLRKQSESQAKLVLGIQLGDRIKNPIDGVNGIVYIIETTFYGFQWFHVKPPVRADGQAAPLDIIGGHEAVLVDKDPAKLYADKLAREKTSEPKGGFITEKPTLW